MLLYNTDGFRPASWSDLDGELVAFSDIAGLESEIESLRAAHPNIYWQFVPQASPIELIARVSDGAIGYAIAGSLAAATARNVYLDFDVAFPVGGKRQFAWAVPERFPELAAELDRFIEKVKRDGTLARLVERYVPELRQFQRLDASGLQERVRTALPQYRQHFRDAQEKTGIDWRLLAALAYQESKWDPAATSETGVRGFMQITEDTARRLGVTNLLDPAQNVLAGARYLRDLKDKLPERIQEPDRTWLALAAYNIGLGHLEDARVLAQRQGFNPDHWTNVKRDPAVAGASRALREGEAGLCARRHAGGVRRPRARLLRCAARAPGAAAAAAPVVFRRAGGRVPRRRAGEELNDTAMP